MNAYIEAALTGEVARTGGATKGNRGRSLYKAAATLAGFDNLSDTEILRALEAAARANRYINTDGLKAAQATILSGIRRGRLERRTIPDDDRRQQQRQANNWPKAYHERRTEDDGDRTRAVLALFDAAGTLVGTPGERYLIKRGINVDALPPGISDALRFHPACPFNAARNPCLIALFTDAVTGEPRAIHRTAVTPNGEKIGRLSLGPMAGCVIRLWPNDAVEQGLVLGEGVETTLAAATRIVHRGTLLQPAWAAASAGNLAKFPALSGIESLTLLVDRDASETGQNAAKECASRWSAADREVIRLTPRVVGVDFNDIVVRQEPTP